MAGADKMSPREEAAAWFARLNQRRVSSEDILAFADWRRIPQNAAAYAEVERLWDTAGPLGADPEIVALTEAAAATVSPHARRRRRMIGWAAAGAAAVTVAALGLWALQRPPVYGTDVGEQRMVTLQDGSQVTLDTASRLVVRYTAGERRVELLEGQALFAVSTDAGRPFIVSAGEARIRALGTRFDVRLLEGGARVVLVEGRVAVSERSAQAHTWTLSPGHQVVTSAPEPVVEPVDPVAATSWTTGRLIFDQTPLGEAVAEMNRYARVPVALEADGIAATPVSGAFDTGDMSAFVAAVGDLYPVTVHRRGDQIVITERRQPSR